MKKLQLAETGNAGVDAEGALIDAAAEGDVHAFAALYDRYLEQVHRYLYYLVGNRTDAEDLTQQVFLSAWQAIGRYRRNGSPIAAWLIRIAHNKAMSHHRRAKETCCLDLELVSRERWADPEGKAVADCDRVAVRRAVLKLKPEQREVIVMRLIEHMDYADIAAALGKSEGNVRVIQHRALVELRRLLADEVNS